jgi:puromycin-sensitive aminopeptidase
MNERNFGQVLEPSRIDSVEDDEILVLEFAETLPNGIGVLTIGFEGALNDKMVGFYRR